MPILPTEHTHKTIKNTYQILIARAIVIHLPAFHFLRSMVSWHIPHPYTKEMSEKSQVVSTLYINYTSQ